MSISMSGLNRREARYLRVRILYTEQNTYGLPQGESDLSENSARPVCYAINRIFLLGLHTKNSKDIRSLLLNL